MTVNTEEKVGAVVQLRTNSTRFPRKVFADLFGTLTAPEIIMQRLAPSETVDRVVFATSSAPEDDELSEFLLQKNLDVFRGELDDVAARYIECSSEHDFDIVVRVTADCPLVDFRIVDRLVRRFMRGDLDFASNSEPIPNWWADGSDISVFSLDSLRRAYGNQMTIAEKEHVTHAFWKRSGYSRFFLENQRDDSKFRFTVDYPEDLEVIRSVLTSFSGAENFPAQSPSYDEIVLWLKSNPDIASLNSEHTRGEGW